jgi:hypothetical protein
MSALIAAILETFVVPFILVVWIARAILFAGGVLFLMTAPFAHKGLGVALLYFAQAVAMTLALHFLRRLRERAIYR